MKKYAETLDFEKLEKIGMPNDFIKRTISISKREEISISKKFRDELCREYESEYIDLRHDDNYRILMFRVGDEGDLPLLKRSKMIHRELGAALISYGYELPVRYNFVKAPDTNIWIGYLDEVAPAPEISGVRKSGRTKRNRA